MITEELIKYVKEEKAKGIKEEVIQENLMKEGWSQEDLNQAFSSLNRLGIEKIIFFVISFAILIFLIARVLLGFLPHSDTSKGLLVLLLNTSSIALNIIFLLSLPQLIIGIIFRKNKYGKLNIITSIIIIIFNILYLFFTLYFLKELGFISIEKQENSYIEYVDKNPQVLSNIPYILGPDELKLVVPEKSVSKKEIDLYIKQTVASVFTTANILYDKVGYGAVENNGDCFAPVSGSLFNPGNNGYSENIATTLNSLKEQNIKEMYCFSVPDKGWAFAVKLENEEGYFCSDVSGTKPIDKPIKNIFCEE